MKYARFEELCQREWRNGFGDVTGLALPAPELAELSADALGSAGIRADEAVNPVTRSVVAIEAAPEGEAATATVTYGRAKWAPPPKTVAIA